MSAQEEQQSQQEASLRQKIKDVDAEIKEANERRKEFDRQLRWLKKVQPQIDAEIVRRIESTDEERRKWVAQLRQQAMDGAWQRHEVERKHAEAKAQREKAEAERIAAATATQRPEQEASAQSQ